MYDIVHGLCHSSQVAWRVEMSMVGRSGPWVVADEVSLFHAPLARGVALPKMPLTSWVVACTELSDEASRGRIISFDRIRCRFPILTACDCGGWARGGAKH